MKKQVAAIIAAGTLLAPSVAKADYYVKPGDTLWGISERYEVDFQRLLQLNPHFENPSMIHVGDFVVLPKGDTAHDLVEYARSLQDVTKYVYGGQNAPYQTDCSGWVQYIYKQFGVDLPRVSRDQARVGQPVKFQDMRKGDLMFFSTRADKVITHVGIYMGDNYWISNLNSKKDVQILVLWGDWTQKHFLYATRVI